MRLVNVGRDEERHIRDTSEVGQRAADALWNESKAAGSLGVRKQTVKDRAEDAGCPESERRSWGI